MPKKKPEIQIEYRAVDSLTLAPYNPRQMSAEEMAHLVKSIQEFGFIDPIIVNSKSGFVIGGNQRLEAAVTIGLKEVPVVEVNLSPEKERALNLALNEISGEWDMPRLKDLLLELDTGALDMDLTGFSEKEIEGLMTQIPPEEEPGEPQGGKMITCPQCGHEFAA